MPDAGVDIIQTTVQILLNRVTNGKNHANKLPPSIHTVPSMFRDQSPISFNPRVVSIGPLHKEDKKLQEFEVHKESSVHNLLRRLDSSPEKTLQSCVQKVNDSIDQIRGCYAGMKAYNDVELSNMMVMDGCFILEFIYNFSYDMPIVTNMLFQQAVIYDLVLLENQIPFFVLNDIYQCTIWKSECDQDPLPLSEFIFPFLKFLHLFKEDLDIKNIDTNTTDDHILGLLHKCYWPRCIIVASDSYSSPTHSAVDLDRAGVNFKPNKYTKWSMAMRVKLHRFRFWAKPTLSMPVLHIHDYTELILRNLMAYEHSTLGINFVTSYVIAMDMLLDTEEDISTLVKSKVLVNNLGSNVEAADMMNSLCKEVAWVHFFYSKEWRMLDNYCRAYWPKNVARLRTTYFNSPWNIIALVAGIVLFGLAVVQTIYATNE
ncbi:hypothetical protein LXL04_032171 [Taraxacum kok-saghyz]